MNKVFLIGRAGKDPESRQVGEHTVVKFSLATTEHYKGEKSTEWHNVIAWNKLAETIAKYVKKGSQIAIEGKLKTTSFEKDDKKQYFTEVVAERLEFLGDAKSEPKKQQEETNDLPFDV